MRRMHIRSSPSIITRRPLAAALALAALSITPAPALAQEPDWAKAEAPGLTDHVQLTFPERFARAGEAYFSPDGSWIIFQAIPADAGNAGAAQGTGGAGAGAYSMYVARLRRAAGDAIVGIEEPIRISPEGSANTCGFFHPREPGRVIFGSTLTPPGASAPSGYQRGTSTYAWQFPTEMDVVTLQIPAISAGAQAVAARIDAPQPLWERAGYDAECAYSPDGRHIVFTAVNPDTLDPDIWVYDSRTKLRRPLVVAPGYDGGPFFSPDGSMICYRSDRQKNDLLQVHIAELVFDDSGAVVATRRERPVTGNEHVNWAPFWHPSSEFLLYTTSQQGHANYEIYAVQTPIGIADGVRPSELRTRRITHASGFDGLPAFSPAGDWLMWTSQRGRQLEGEAKPSSQLWIARVGDLMP